MPTALQQEESLNNNSILLKSILYHTSIHLGVWFFIRRAFVIKFISLKV